MYVSLDQLTKSRKEPYMITFQKAHHYSRSARNFHRVANDVEKSEGTRRLARKAHQNFVARAQEAFSWARNLRRVNQS